MYLYLLSSAGVWKRPIVDHRVIATIVKATYGDGCIWFDIQLI